MVEYTYDAWGKVLSVTGSMADTVGAINPMRYRGYYLDKETGYYYLQSRYYDPDICRFINADEPSMVLAFFEDAQLINLFFYGDNEPSNNKDTTGHIAIVIFGATISLGTAIALMSFTVFTVAYLTNSNFRNGINQMFYYVAKSMVDGVGYIATVISEAVSNAKRGRKYSGYEDHHIVAQSDWRAELSRNILSRYKISVNSPYNKISMKKTLHKHLHSNAYHMAVYIVIKSLELKSGSFNTKKYRVISGLVFIGAILSAANRKV